MASLYRDPKSPYWFLRYKASDGKWRSKSLRPLRNNIPADTRQARAKRDQASLLEHTRGPQRDLWASWVPAYIQSRYTGETVTRARTFNMWVNLAQFLDERGIAGPQELTYRDCMEYMTWRTTGRSAGVGPDRATKSTLPYFDGSAAVVACSITPSRKKAAHNTARLELTILGMICEEAVRRGIIARNPAQGMKIPSVKSKEKPELSDADIAKIRQGLKSCPDWMSHAFEIALHQGCRLSETAFFVDDIDLAGNRIHFRRTKGDKPFTVPLNPNLKPKLQNLVGKGTQFGRIFNLPANASRDFISLFKKLGIKATFHSTRVTVASRLARAGYPIAKAMRLLNHSSTLIHRTYQRLQAGDVADAYDVLKFP